MHWKTFAISIVTMLPMVCGAQDADPVDFRHAKFVDGDRSLGNRVRFPATAGDVDINVVCRGHSTAKGRLRNTICSAADDPNRDFVNAVSKRINSARLLPAMVDGEPQEVDFQFTVNFRRTGEEETISVYYNNGHNAERLGLDYFGAQRYSPHVWPAQCRQWPEAEVFIEAATIDASGSPRKVNAMGTRTRILESCRGALMRQLEAGRWIPAMKDGQFVGAVWMSPIVLNVQDVEF
jgi:hypothetical protein